MRKASAMAFLKAPSRHLPAKTVGNPETLQSGYSATGFEPAYLSIAYSKSATSATWTMGLGFFPIEYYDVIRALNRNHVRFSVLNQHQPYALYLLSSKSITTQQLRIVKRTDKNNRVSYKTELIFSGIYTSWSGGDMNENKNVGREGRLPVAMCEGTFSEFISCE